MNVRIFVPTTIFAVALSGAASAKSLQQDIGDLLENHPRLKWAEQNIKAHDAAKSQVESEYYPQVMLEAEYGIEETDNPSIRREYSRVGMPSRSTLETHPSMVGLTVNQLLIDGGQRSGRNERAKTNIELSHIAYDSAVQKLLFEASSAYIGVIRQARRLTLAQQNERITLEGLNMQRSQVREGGAIEVDVLAAEARLQVVRERRVMLESQLQKSMTRYAQIFNRLPNLKSMKAPRLRAKLLPKSVDEAVARAVANAPLMRDRRKAVELAKSDVDIATGGYFPRVDLVGRARYQDEYDGIEGYEKSGSVRVRMTWDLFSGFATKSAVEEAGHRLLASEKDREYVTRQVEEDVRLSWEDLKSARQRVALFRKALSVAMELRAARRTLVEAGRETELNALNAELEVYNARISLVEAEFDVHLAAYRLLLAMGEMTPANI